MARTVMDVEELTDRLIQPLSDAFPGASAVSITQMPTGMSSLTYAVSFDDDRGSQRIAVKVAPPGLEPVRNRDVLRQARVLGSLSTTGVIVPRVLFEDAGAPPEVPPLFAMTFVDGECFEPLSDEGDVPPREVVHGRARSAATMLAALHAVDPAAIGLGDEAPIGLRNEVERWIRLFEAVDEGLRPTAAMACGERLLASIPAVTRPSLIHGDFRLGNIIYGGTVPRAIIDWEIWSLGDPRVDLAWFLLNSDPAKPNATRSDVGMPTTSELVSCYELGRDGPVVDLRWFHALARFKQAAASAFIVKNNRKRPGSDPRQERIVSIIPTLVGAALDHLDG